MKISLSLLSVGMIAAAASAGGTDTYLDYTGGGLTARAPSQPQETLANVLYSTGFDAGQGYALGNLATGTLNWDAWGADPPTLTSTFNIVTNTAARVEGGSNTTQKLRNQWGSNATSGTTWFLWQDNNTAGFGHTMLTRKTEIDFDLLRTANTVSNNKGQTQLRTFDTTFSYVAMGFIFDNYATGTNPSIRGLAYLGTPGVGTAGTYAFTLETGTFQRDNLMHHYYTAYDACTGIVTWGWDRGLASEKEWFFDTTGYQGGAQYNITEFDFLGARNSATVVGNMLVDNVNFSWEACPAPGAAALLGLAGLAGRRRRA